MLLGYIVNSRLSCATMSDDVSKKQTQKNISKQHQNILRKCKKEIGVPAKWVSWHTCVPIHISILKNIWNKGSSFGEDGDILTQWCNFVGC